MKAFRIASRLHRVFDGAGSALFPGRWNELGQQVVYCGESYAIAMLERLCYASLGRAPKGDVYVEVALDEDLVELFDEVAHPGWDQPGSPTARDFGSLWWHEGRSLALSVPSVVTRVDRNLVINATHPDLGRAIVSVERPVIWDSRLFARPNP